MNSRTLWFLVAAAIVTMMATPAHAQATRTWVSGVGDDVNPCSRTAPCKTFAGAISKTAAGGEINCIDPGGFGAVTITKSMTIDCGGTFGSTLASGTNGVIVNGAGAIVVLRNLSINGGTPAGPGLNGIRYLQGASLVVENVTISNFTAGGTNGFGILFAPSAGQNRLHVINATIINCGTGTTGGGIGIVPTGAGSTQTFLTGVHLDQNSRGLVVDGSATTAVTSATIVGSTVNGNVNNGITTIAAAPVLNLMIKQTTIANNLRGVQISGAGTSARIGSSMVTGNGAGVQVLSGTLVSYKDNEIDGNGTNGTPITGTPLN